MIAILDYGIGNLRSAQKALQKVGATAEMITDPKQAMQADAVVLPGVGAFGNCMQALHRCGLDQVVVDSIEAGKPFLGICVGMQMLYKGSEETSQVQGLGIIDAMVRRLPQGQKIPQMQWNQLTVDPLSSSFGFLNQAWVYFVHSFAPEYSPEAVASCDYGSKVVAAIEKDNIWATQFHPEKSGKWGLALLEKFARLAR